MNEFKDNSIFFLRESFQKTYVMLSSRKMELLVSLMVVFGLALIWWIYSSSNEPSVNQLSNKNTTESFEEDSTTNEDQLSSRLNWLTSEDYVALQDDKITIPTGSAVAILLSEGNEAAEKMFSQLADENKFQEQLVFYVLSPTSVGLKARIEEDFNITEKVSILIGRETQQRLSFTQYSGSLDIHELQQQLYNVVGVESS